MALGLSMESMNIGGLRWSGLWLWWCRDIGADCEKGVMFLLEDIDG